MKRSTEKFRRAALRGALCLGLAAAACSGTVPGLGNQSAQARFGTVSRGSGLPPPSTPPAPAAGPYATTRGVPAAPRAYGSPSTPAAPSSTASYPPPSASAPSYSAPAPSPPAASATATFYPAPAAPSPPPPSTAREKQIAILADAVAALRQEVARSYEHSAKLESEAGQLRNEISRLKRELSKSRSENEQLKNQIHTLEKKLREIQTPPPDQSASQPAG